ncbi:InlB B-repeat-containing protein [Vescimonas sanitatis]|uniref:InlB B-repeat-containing protein n=1 Tax=Vescimonas sanitatis TaxID=3376993 RepID=UPI003B7FEB13
MKRRLLPILMTLVLVCALPIWAAFVTSGDVTNPLVCTAAATEPTLQGMIDKANAGDTITLNSNTEIAATLQITKNLTLDLNGCTLRMTGTGSVLKVSGRATLTIQDSSAEGTGTITGGNAEYGGGVYVDDYAALKMTGGCITGCHASRGGGGIYSSGNLYMGGTAKIEKCTGSDDAIWNRENSDIYADGGTVDGTVNNQGTIKRSEGAAAVTVFNGTVYNRSAGKIEAGIYGIYNGTVENNGTITGGTFYGAVMIRKGSLSWVSTGSISGGTFYGSIVNEAGPEQVTGGTFAVRFDTGDGTKPEPTLVPWNGKVAKPTDDPTKSGYTFIGWEDADGAYDFSKSVIAPLTLTAKWEKNPSSGGYYYYPTTDTKTDDTKGSPKTADPGAALYGALALLSLTGMVALNGKKR